MKRKFALLAVVAICSAGIAQAETINEMFARIAAEKAEVQAACAHFLPDYVAEAKCESAEQVRRMNQRLERQSAENDARLKKRFAEIDAHWEHEKKCAAGKPEIGMTKDEAVKAWCQPWRVNTDQTAFGVREQWVYGEEGYTRGYLYFENGRLVAIQRRN